MDIKQYDVVIIGAGLNGLVSAYTLASYGIKCCVLEKSAIAGGGNQSFRNEDGDIFDSGYHALDYMRSPITTRLFEKVLKGNFHKHNLKRGIVIDGTLLAYNESVEYWPEPLKSMISVPTQDNLTGDITKEKLSNLYGSEFIDYCYDHILPSYPSEVRALSEGRLASSVIGMIYPWFFPKVKKIADRKCSESESFHNKMRSNKHQVLYPSADGFYGFIEGLISSIDKDYCDILLGCNDIKIVLDESNKCKEVTALGVKYMAESYFWCAPFFGLAHLLGLPMPQGASQTLVLGSFKFEGEFDGEFHEILLGDKKYKINRISFPNMLKNEKNNLVQVEYLYPTDEIDSSSSEWCLHWLDCLLDIGLTTGLKMISYRFDIQPKGMITKNSLDVISEEYSSLIASSGTDIYVPVVSAGPENINRIVPSVIERTINYISNK